MILGGGPCSQPVRLLSNHPSKLILENNFILLIIKGIMRDHVSTVSRAHRPETESSTQEELSSANITCFMITPIITILRWFSLIFYEVALQFFFVRGALLQLTATRVGSRETKSCKALTRICFDNTASFMNLTFLLILRNFFSPQQLFSSSIRGTLQESLDLENKELQISRRIWSRWHQDKRPRCPSLPGLASPRLGGGSCECT